MTLQKLVEVSVSSVRIEGGCLKRVWSVFHSPLLKSSVTSHSKLSVLMFSMKRHVSAGLIQGSMDQEHPLSMSGCLLFPSYYSLNDSIPRCSVNEVYTSMA